MNNREKMINDKYVKVKNINDKYYGMHLITGKMLYNPYTNFINNYLSDYTKKRIKEDVAKAIQMHKNLRENKNET